MEDMHVQPLKWKYLLIEWAELPPGKSCVTLCGEYPGEETHTPGESGSSPTGKHSCSVLRDWLEGSNTFPPCDCGLRQTYLCGASPTWHISDASPSHVETTPLGIPPVWIENLPGHSPLTGGSGDECTTSTGPKSANIWPLILFRLSCWHRCRSWRCLSWPRHGDHSGPPESAWVSKILLPALVCWCTRPVPTGPIGPGLWLCTLPLFLPPELLPNPVRMHLSWWQLALELHWSGKLHSRLSRQSYHWSCSWTCADSTTIWMRSEVSLFHTKRKYSWIGLKKSLACLVLKADAIRKQAPRNTRSWVGCRELLLKLMTKPALCRVETATWISCFSSWCEAATNKMLPR